MRALACYRQLKINRRRIGGYLRPFTRNPTRHGANPTSLVSKRSVISMRWMKFALWIVCATALSALVFTFVVVQSQQTLLRWRSEQQMADMHRICSPILGLFPDCRVMPKTTRQSPF